MNIDIRLKFFVFKGELKILLTNWLVSHGSCSAEPKGQLDLEPQK